MSYSAYFILQVLANVLVRAQSIPLQTDPHGAKFLRTACLLHATCGQPLIPHPLQIQ